MNKKILSILLAVLIISAALTPAAFAADTTINTVEITDVVEPALNGEATEYFEIPENSGYSYDTYNIDEYMPCYWTYNSTKPETYDDVIYDGESIYLSETKGFTKPGYYTISMFIRANEGYTFADGVTATVNGNSANILVNYRGYATVYYTFDYLGDVDFDDISAVNISGVSAPVDGAIGKFNCTFPGTDEYSKFSNEATEREPFDPSVIWIITPTKPATWVDIENGEYHYSNSEFKFEKGKFYTFVVRVSASNGYEFTGSTEFTVNSLDANAELLSKFEADVWYTFEVAEKMNVNSVAVNNVKEPVLNEEVTFGCDFEKDMGYIFKHGVWYATDKKPANLNEVYDGIMIYDNMIYYPENGKTTEYFSDKYYYTFYALIETDGGDFNPAVTATINGKKAELDAASLDKGILGVYYTFDKLPSSNDENPPVSDKKLASINVAQKPDRLVYGYGDKLDINGLRVTGSYNDGADAGEIDSSKLTFEGFNTSSPGNKTVTVKYENLTATFDVQIEFTILHWIMYIVLFGWIWM